jgi:hypothetical protein
MTVSSVVSTAAVKSASIAGFCSLRTVTVCKKGSCLMENALYRGKANCQVGAPVAAVCPGIRQLAQLACVHQGVEGSTPLLSGRVVKGGSAWRASFRYSVCEELSRSFEPRLIKHSSSHSLQTLTARQKLLALSGCSSSLHARLHLPGEVHRQGAVRHSHDLSHR